MSSSNVLTSHQQKIFDLVISYIEEKKPTFFFDNKSYKENMISITGAAGTGKSYLTMQIVKYLLKKSKDNFEYIFSVTAPTHKAASVLSELFRKENLPVSAKTIHSFLNIKPFIDYNTGEEKFKQDHTKSKLESTSILIVDESSMINSNLFDIIIDAMKQNRINFVIFVGDYYQLPPVNESISRVHELPKKFELLEVVRQEKNNDIITLANKLRVAIEKSSFPPLEDQLKPYLNNSDNIEFFNNKNDFLEDFYKDKEWYKQDKILASYTNKNVDSFNRVIRKRYWQERGKNNLPTLVAGDKLRFNKPYAINNTTIYSNNAIVTIERAELKYSNELEIQYWDCLEKNSIEQQVFRVVEPKSKKVFNDKLRAIATKAKREKNKVTREKLWAVYYDIRDMFADVQYIYSMTIHKLQGSTYDDIYIDMFSLLNNRYISLEEKYRYTYVAVTRARKNAKIFIKNLDSSTLAEQIDTQKEFSRIDSILKNLKLDNII